MPAATVAVQVSIPSLTGRRLWVCRRRGADGDGVGDRDGTALRDGSGVSEVIVVTVAARPDECGSPGEVLPTNVPSPS